MTSVKDPFSRIGGEQGVRKLVDRFYDLMDSLPEAREIRVLHPMEREFISIEAYDYLLELYRLGLIGPPQLEILIENCAFLTSLPATRAQISKMALRAFTENLELQGLGSSH